MKINIDGKQIEIFPNDKNIVDAADRAKIALPAPCYRANRAKGCCKVCVIEINGENKYACVIKPLDGMNIIVDREDLNQVRKERMKKYQKMPKNAAQSCSCDCSGTANNCC
ncbi:MAG: 2Fe-2S iron-sulfur cluster-binding protein [Candidatus Omnitrophota bacterium]